MWMEVDEYERTAAEGGRVEEEEEAAERQRAVTAWLRLEEIRERLEGDHPVSRAMDRWLGNAAALAEDEEAVGGCLRTV